MRADVCLRLDWWSGLYVSNLGSHRTRKWWCILGSELTLPVWLSQESADVSVREELVLV